MSGVAARWVLPLEKCLSNRLPRSQRLEEDLVHGHYVSKHYHQGNRTEVWQQRPLAEEMLQYAAADVRYLHLLADELKLPQAIMLKVRRGTFCAHTILKKGPLLGNSTVASIPLSCSLPQVRNATSSRMRTGSVGAEAPDIVRPSDLRMLSERSRARDIDGRSSGGSSTRTDR